jgi:hypothetical protein
MRSSRRRKQRTPAVQAARAAQRRAHHATCLATHLPHDAGGISICRAVNPSTAVMTTSTARAGGESATCTCHAAMRWKTAYTCQYIVHNAGVRLRSAHCRRSIPTSRRRRIRSLKLHSAAKVMHRCETVAARSAHSYARVHAHAPSSHTRVSAVCECAGCASVSAMWTLRVPCWAPCGGSHTRVGSHAGWDISGYRYTRTLISTPGLMPCRVASRTPKHSTAVFHHNRLHSRGQLGRLLYVPPTCKLHASTHSTLCEYQEYRCGCV